MPIQPRYKYEKLMGHFREKIHRGTLRVGQKVAPELDLMEEFQLSRNTVRQALKQLEADGYLYRVRGRGTFVREVVASTCNKIALVIYDAAYATHPVTAGLIRGIDVGLRARGYLLDVLASHRSHDEERVCGLRDNYAGLLVGAHQVGVEFVEHVKAPGVPFLFVKNYPAGMEDHAVLIDFEKAGFLAATHLAELGRRELTLLLPETGIQIVNDFRAGVTAACLEHGIRLRAANRLACGFGWTGKEIADAVEAIATADHSPDCLIAMDDTIAVAVMRGLAVRGIRVPEDVSVVGCNDTDVARYSVPRLTTLSIPTEELGQRAADALLDRIENVEHETLPIVLSPELIVGDSTSEAKHAD